MAADRTTSGGWRGQPLLLAVVLLGILGMAVAGYLTYVHYNEDALVCTVGGCETVQQSDYSTMLGVPIAIFGFLMFLTVTLLALARMTDRGPLPSDMATMERGWRESVARRLWMKRVRWKARSGT